MPDGFDAYLGGLSKNQRSNYRRNVNKLGKAFEFQVDVVREGPELEREFEAFVEMHQAQWKAVGKLGHFGDWPRSREFTRDLVDTLAGTGRAPDPAGRRRRGRLVLLLLRADGTYYWRLPARLTGEEWDQFALGRVGLLKMIEVAAAEGATAIEAGTGAYEYKEKLNADTLPLCSSCCAAGASPRAAARVALRWATCSTSPTTGSGSAASRRAWASRCGRSGAAGSEPASVTSAGMLTACLIAAALAAGVTGAWSPCGLSMVDTLAPHGYARRLRTSLAACATFALGALAGGALTFGGLALAGAALGAGGTAAVGAAAVVAVAAAVAEARGLRIAPQIRRQVPEAWRRVLPVPLAAAGYGVLLGLGFTTFVLSFAVWALAGVSIALGDPALGLAIGLAFGAGRALPVIALAPFAATDRGGAVTAAMCERPAILLGLRRVDAVAMAACALALGPV